MCSWAILGVVYLLYGWAGFTLFQGLHRKWDEEEEGSGDQRLAVEAAEAELLELKDSLLLRFLRYWLDQRRFVLLLAYFRI